MRSRIRYVAMAACLLLSTAMVGCESGRERPPAVTVRVLHAAPERSTVEFLREQRSEAQLDYRQASGRLTFDADQYNFGVRVLDAGGSTVTSIGTFTQDLAADNTYLIAFTEAAGVLTPIVVEKAVFTGTSSEVTAMHAAPSLGAMSVYIEPDGVAPSGATPIGTLGFGETVPSATREPGTYRLSLTDASDSSNVLMTSEPFALEQGQSYAYAIIDPAEDTNASVMAVLIGADTTLLFDQSVQSSLTVINAAADGNPRDIFVDDDFSVPAVAALPYLARSSDVPVTSGARKISVTPAGNTGVIEAENSASYARSRYHIALVGGDPGELEAVTAFDDRRRFAGQARIGLMNAASQYGAIEYFIVPPGTDISNLSSTLVLETPGITTRVAVTAGDYELTVRERGGSVLAGPVPITLAGSGVYTVLTANGAAPGTVEFVYFEDFLN
jgi:hypothetical protein